MRLYGEFHRADELSPLVVEGIALEIMGEASRRLSSKPHSVPPRWLAEARDILHEQYSKRLTVNELARCVHVHPVHLAREFRRFYECTIGDYVRRRRIEFACQELVQSESSLSEIAMAAGFFDQSHFSKTFKQHTGNSPQAYRAAFRPR
jgi:AraC family transcriptional regulator